MIPIVVAALTMTMPARGALAARFADDPWIVYNRPLRLLSHLHVRVSKRPLPIINRWDTVSEWTCARHLEIR